MSSKDKSDEPLINSEDIEQDLLDLEGNLLESTKHLRPSSRPSMWRKVGSAARSYGRRLIEREAVTVEVPGLGEAVAVYETYRFGREVWDFIKEERVLAKAAEKSHKEISATSPYFRKEEVEAKLGEGTKTGARVITEEQHSTLVKPYDSKSNYPYLNYRVQIYKPSVEAVVSKAGSSLIAQEEERFMLQKAAQTSKGFEENNLIGDANEKYQYLIHNIMKQVGSSDHFSRVYNPKAVIRLEKATVEQMHRDGYELQEIAHAYQKNSPFIRGLNDSQINQHADRIFDDVLHSKPLQESREAIARWRKENGIPETDRRSPHEFEFVREYKAKALADRSTLLRSEADRLLSEYQVKPEMKLSTKKEYMLEEARNRAAGNADNNDQMISVKLLLANHAPSEIVKTVEELSPHSTGEGYGVRVATQASEYLSSHDGQRLMRLYDEFLEENPQLVNETRLDKLNLDTRVDRANSQHSSSNRDSSPVAHKHDQERDRSPQ